MFRRVLTAAAAALLLTSCDASQTPPPQIEPAKVAPILDTPDAVDTHSYAKPLEARVANVDLDLALDFGAKRVAGTAALDVIAKPGVRRIILDSKGLEISGVADADGKPLKWNLGADDPEKGAALTVDLPGDGKQRIVINYRSKPDAAALQWLTAITSISSPGRATSSAPITGCRR